MSSRLLWGLATATILLQICSVCWCKVTVSVKFISYRNTIGRDHEGKRCDPRIIPPHGRCDHYFEICLAKITRHNPNTANWISNCDYGSWKTLPYGEENSNTFDHDMRTVANPIIVNIEDSEEGVAVRVRVMDHDSGSRGDSDIVDYLWFNYLIEQDNGLFKDRDSADPYKRLITGTRSTTEPTSLTIDFSAYCAENFYMYQGQCTKYCKGSRSDHLGQYSCTEDGDKRCFEGWKDETTDCTTNEISCLSHQCKNNGRCIGGKTRFLCNCTDGFKGQDCSESNFLFAAAAASQQGGGDDSKGLIIGMVLGLFLLILIIVIVVALLVRERRKRKMKEQGTSTAVSTTTMGQQTHPGTTNMGTGGSYANPAFFSSDSSIQTDNLRNQRAAQGTQTANGHGVKVMEAGLLSPPPYKVADIPTGGSGRFNNLTYGEQHVGAGGVNSGSGSVENIYDDVGLNKKY